jgi:hypothetical protein
MECGIPLGQLRENRARWWLVEAGLLKVAQIAPPGEEEQDVVRVVDKGLNGSLIPGSDLQHHVDRVGAQASPGLSAQVAAGLLAEDANLFVDDLGIGNGLRDAGRVPRYGWQRRRLSPALTESYRLVMAPLSRSPTPFVLIMGIETPYATGLVICSRSSSRTDPWTTMEPVARKSFMASASDWNASL